MKLSRDTIIIGADHNGFALKEALKALLEKRGYAVLDKGARAFEQADDYPDAAFRVTKDVEAGKGWGVLICGSSVGVCIAANKARGIRAASVYTVKQVELAREHDDVNVLCLSGWTLTSAAAFKLVDAFLKTPFSKEARHVRRIKKIERFEKRK